MTLILLKNVKIDTHNVCCKQLRVQQLAMLKFVCFITKENAKMIVIMLVLASCTNIAVHIVTKKQSKGTNIQLINACV